MKTASEVCRFTRRHWCVAAVGLALTLGPTALRGEVHLDVLKTRTDSFTNVTVYGRSKTDIFIRHSQGIANVKLEKLDPETIARLNSGDAPDPSAAPSKTGGATTKHETSSTATSTPESDARPNVKSQLRLKISPILAKLTALSSFRLSPNILAGVVAVYLFFCFCMKLICEKAGAAPGFMVWFPVLQMFPLLRAARMSGWWCLAFLIPVLNLVAHIVWSIKIVQARGKSVWAAIFLILPLTNFFSFLYLAFSSVEDSPDAGGIKVAGQSAALGEA